MLLTYDAVDTQGKTTKDVVEAMNPREAVEVLRRRGLFVTRIAEDTQNAQAKAVHRSAVKGRLPLATLVLFTRQMAMLLRAGSGIVPAITAIRKQMRRPTHAALLEQVVSDLEEGSTLTDCLRKHPDTFDPVYCAIIAAGEASASLPNMFERLAEIVGKKRALQKKLIGTMAYPALLVAMCFKITLILLLFVLPRFDGMFQQLGVEAPATTQALLAAGQFLQAHWVAVLAGAGVVVSTLVWFLVSPRGVKWISDVQTSIPGLGRLRSRMIQAQVLRTMGMLLESRVGLLDTLDLARRSTRNRSFQELFTNLEETVTAGGQMSTAFEQCRLIEPYICQAVRTGEDSGNLGGAMTYCADVLDESNTELIGVITKLIEPVILIGMGVFVGGVAISLFLPLFDLTSAIK
ncbi:MAG: type II secretion system F family protein [Planctomycetes bacterium]|nr:type II secretion system F family protein [Planctomycetota bacterium]